MMMHQEHEATSKLNMGEVLLFIGAFLLQAEVGVAMFTVATENHHEIDGGA
jgi:hypothetical protein